MPAGGAVHSIINGLEQVQYTPITSSMLSRKSGCGLT
jgi:hypothetical protein